MSKKAMSILCAISILGNVYLYKEFNDEKVKSEKLSESVSETNSKLDEVTGRLIRTQGNLKEILLDLDDSKKQIEKLKNEKAELEEVKASRGGGLAYVEYMTIEATAYTHTGNPTYTGVYPSRGMIAVDPNVIPLGTKVYVEGYGYAVATDTGGLIQGNIIDLFMETEEECINWGRRTVDLYIIE